MKTALVMFNGKIIQYTPNIYIQIDYDDKYMTYSFHLHTSEGWTYHYNQLSQVHQLALDAVAVEEALR